MRCAKGKRPFVITLLHCADRRFGRSDDGRQDHDSQKNRRTENTLSVAVLKMLPDERYEHNQSEKPIYDRRNAREQVHDRL